MSTEGTDSIEIDGQMYDRSIKHFSIRDFRKILNQAELAKLSSLKNLTSVAMGSSDLEIQETSIDGRGLPQLKTLKNLKCVVLDVWNENFTFEELCDDSAQMPNCVIVAKGRGEFCGGTFDGHWKR